MVSSSLLMEMRCSWGELKRVEVMPVALAPVGALGRVLVYLLDVGRGEDVSVGPSWALSSLPTGAGAEVGEIWLTPREMDVLRLVALGWSNEHVAKELEISLHTVRSHVANIRGKLDAVDRFEAVMAALRLGILELR